MATDQTSDAVVSISNGEVALWVEEGRSIHLKATSPHGDPVELSAAEALELAEQLRRMAALVEGYS
jgi:hypothetical protein